MAIDFSALEAGLNSGKLIEPKKIFTTLNRDPKFKRPLDEQSEVLEKWFLNRNRKDNVFKMNTGSGKTFVGLLSLQSSLNESVYPAVYITPDRYLTSQVVEEAGFLGIDVTEDENDTAFLAGRAILVANVKKLFNGKSHFGVGIQGKQINIGAVVIDDAHACLATIGEQFSIFIPNDTELYRIIFKMFEQNLIQQNEYEKRSIETRGYGSFLQVPFWAWKDKASEVLKLFFEHKKEEGLDFSLPLIGGVLDLCRCLIATEGIHISPHCVPIDQIPSFNEAARRIYMTATLANDGILVSHFGADPTLIADPIKPSGVGVIGDRIILAPQEINPSIQLNEIQELARYWAETINVCVIVPSIGKAEQWRQYATRVLTKDTISSGIREVRESPNGLTVLINKYDGIDLPENACRLMIIDGLPQVYGLAERHEARLLEGTDMAELKQIQRLEQGMGRGVRSEDDYCAVLLVGGQLAKLVHSPSSRSRFSAATQTQLNVSERTAKQLKGESLTEIANALLLCINRDKNWLRVSKTALVNGVEGVSFFIDPTVVPIRKAFDKARDSRWADACRILQEAINILGDSKTKGYMKTLLAEFTYNIDRSQSQLVLQSARELNKKTIKPLDGVIYQKLSNPTRSQAEQIVNHLAKFTSVNDAIIDLQSVLDDLVWDEAFTKRFESSICELGTFIGFNSQRPEEEINEGPDNLWGTGGMTYFVIECKSGVSNRIICKADCNQLHGSISWFNNNYDDSCKAIPIMFHPVARFDSHASPSPEFKIITPVQLDGLKSNILSLYNKINLSQLQHSPQIIGQEIERLSLTGSKIITQFSIPPAG